MGTTEGSRDKVRDGSHGVREGSRDGHNRGFQGQG